MKHSAKIMVVAGESSGDAHAAKLVRSITEAADGRVEFFGATGPQMRAAGVESVVNSDDFSAVGPVEIGKMLPTFLKAYQKLKKEAVRRKADVVILVDFPDFNLRLARALKRSGLKIVYYISPQIWAWRQYRLTAIRKYVDLLITILPFEKAWYAERGFSDAVYVGHPLANEVRVSTGRDEFCRRHDLDPDKTVISLLPGSRSRELAHMLPVMIESASLMSGKRPDIQFVIALGPSRKTSEVDSAVAKAISKGLAMPQALRVIRGETYDALGASDAAAVTSGTATLEAAIIGTPLAVVYKTSALNYAMFRPLISVPYYSLVNLIAGRSLAAELIQRDLTPETLAAELFRLITPEINENMRRELKALADLLGAGGASRRAAAAVLQILG